MKLKDHILAKMQQNKDDRAKHQEMVVSLDNGLIYLQGQLDLVEQMEKSQAEQQVLAQKALDDAKAAADAQAKANPESPSDASVQAPIGPAASALSLVPPAPEEASPAPASS